MATTVTLLTSGTSTGQNTSQATGTFTPPSSGILVFVCAMENTGTGGGTPLSGLTDSAGRDTTSKRYSRTWSPGNASGDGVSVVYYTVSSAVLTASTITIATAGFNSRKAWALYHIAGFPTASYGDAALNAFLPSAPYGSSTTTPTINETYNSIQNGDVIIGFLGLEGAVSPTRDSDTVDGAWSNPGTFTSNSTGSTANGLFTQYKIGTYTGSTTPAGQTFNPTLATAVDGLIGAIGIIQTSATNPAAAPTIGTITSSTVDLTWSVPWGHWPVSDYTIEYRLTSVGGAWTTFDPGHVASTALTKTVTGLAASTAYDFNIRSVGSAANSFAVSTTGAIASATTSTSSVSTSITAGVISAATTTLSPSVTSAVFTGITAPVVSTSSTLYGATPLAVASTGITSPVVTSPFLTASPAVLLSTRSYFRPSSDSSVGSWTITPLWSKVGEVVPYDGDYISSEVITSGTTSIAKLALTT